MISEIIEIMERRAAMRSKFDEQLLELNKEMIEMGNKIVQSIKNAIEALIARDKKAPRRFSSPCPLIHEGVLFFFALLLIMDI
jgi:phosphate uptake regulator